MRKKYFFSTSLINRKNNMQDSCACSKNHLRCLFNRIFHAMNVRVSIETVSKPYASFFSVCMSIFLNPQWHSFILKFAIAVSKSHILMASKCVNIRKYLIQYICVWISCSLFDLCMDFLCFMVHILVLYLVSLCVNPVHSFYIEFSSSFRVCFCMSDNIFPEKLSIGIVQLLP